ncbi:6723_t:CDS:2 [Diversispora eburnea]|uniref:Amino-acid acetyltransferase, mitochondrial n=1 Tax=Diversispora eburnea TaxID=1213867 RepID=A0A9N8VCB1_9GLOM|nr:6723_t:CDS:2 [Diversispora eburnea]
MTNLRPQLYYPFKKISPASISKQFHFSRVSEKRNEIDRDLILEVLSTVPSPREVKSYIKRFTVPPIKVSRPPPPPLPSSPSLKPEKQVQQQQIQQELKEKFIDELFSTRIEHVALIKIQGPFTPLDLKYVAKTLVHSQKLGMMLIAILDNDEWKEMLKEGPLKFIELKKKMMEEAAKISEAIENVGGRSTPIYDGIFTLTKKNDINNYKNDALIGRTLPTDAGAKINVSLNSPKSCINLGQIPLILPIALDGLLIQRTISANSGMIELSRAISNSNLINFKTPQVVSQVELTKIIVINSEGGIPSEERRGSHVFINIQQEYESIKQSYKVNPQWKITHPTGFENLKMIKSCLENLPSTASAIMVPAYSPTVLISNLIKDKPVFSSSLPLNASITPSTTTTVLRHGFPVYFHDSLNTINVKAFQSLIESSFGKKLNFEKYFERLKNCLKHVIVVGDYQGIAVITMEDIEGNNEKEKVIYLDKFSVTPKAQGVGVADILWKQMQIRYPNLMWRSRNDNNIGWKYASSRNKLDDILVWK